MKHHFSILLCTLFVIWHLPSGAADIEISNKEPKNFEQEQLMAPSVNLGPDTVACSSLVLDAGNPGATYFWSTNATTQIITVSSSGIYWVDVTDGTGTTRDSIEVEIFSIPASPTVSDLDICGAGEAQLIAGGTATYFAWYDSASGGNLLGAGDTISSIFLDSTTVYVEAVNGPSVPFSAGLLVPGESGGSGSNFYSLSAGNDRGLAFDALEAFVLNKVTVHADQPLTGTIKLLDAANSTINSWSVSFPSGGAHEISLDVYIPEGNGYKLTLANSAATSLYIDLPVTFPFTENYIRFVSGFPIAGHYSYFYDLQVSQPGCTSSRMPVAVNVLPSPSINIPADTFICGASYTLDVTNAGAIYNWSTGDTGPTISLQNSDTVSVAVSIGNCVVEDTFAVSIFSVPTDPVPVDVDICGGGISLPSVPSNADYYVWYDSAVGGQILGIGDTLIFPVTDSSVIYVEAGNGNSAPASAGLSVPLGASGSGYFALSAGNERGMEFDALEPFTLDQVTIYSDQSLIGTVALKDSTGNTISTWPVNFPNGGEHLVNLNVDIPEGNGYVLTLANSSPTSLYIDIPVTYPFTTGYVRFASGSPIASHYSYFYNWRVSQPGCNSNRVPVAINVLPEPDLDLGRDTVGCGQPITLSAAFPGATYAWSNGDVTATTTLSASDTLSVAVTLGNCTVSDTVLVNIYQQPEDAIIGDSSRCGIGPLTLQATANNADYFVWYSDPAIDSMIAVGDIYEPLLQNTQTLYVEAGAGPAPFSAGKPTIGGTGGGYSSLAPGNMRGLKFRSNEDFILNQVTVYVDGPLTADLSLRDFAGDILYQLPVSFPDSGGHVVNLNFEIAAGNGYELLLSNMMGAGLYIDIPVNYPIINQFIEITASVPIAGHYSFFYDWKISQPGCRSNRVPTTLTVELPLDLGEDIYSCDPVTVDAGNAGASHLWSTGETTSAITIGETGEYSVQISNGTGCTVFDTINVEIPQSAGLEDDGILCGNTLVTLYDASSTFLWSTGETSPTIDIANPGTYSVIVNEPRGCVLTDTIVVSGFDSFPVVDLGVDFSACSNATLNLGNPGLSYLWSTGDTTQSIVVSASGTYVGTVSNANECAASDTIAVLITPIPTAAFSITEITNFQFFFNNLSFPFSSYTWNFGDGSASNQISPTHTYTDTGTYIVQLIASNVCGNDTLLDTIQVMDPTRIVDPRSVSGIRVYPVPAQDQIYIDISELPAASQGMKIDLMDMNGRLISHSFKQQLGISEPILIDVSDLPAGMYALRIQYADRVVSWNIPVSH